MINALIETLNAFSKPRSESMENEMLDEMYTTGNDLDSVDNSSKMLMGENEVKNGTESETREVRVHLLIDPQSMLCSELSDTSVTIARKRYKFTSISSTIGELHNALSTSVLVLLHGSSSAAKQEIISSFASRHSLIESSPAPPSTQTYTFTRLPQFLNSMFNGQVQTTVVSLPNCSSPSLHTCTSAQLAEIASTELLLHSLSSYLLNQSHETQQPYSTAQSPFFDFCTNHSHVGIDVIILLRTTSDIRALALIKDISMIQQASQHIALFHPTVQQPCVTCSALALDLTSLTNQLETLQQLYTADQVKHARHIQVVTEQLQDQLVTLSDAHDIKVKEMVELHKRDIMRIKDERKDYNEQRVGVKIQTNETEQAIERGRVQDDPVDESIDVDLKSDHEEYLSDSACSTPKCQPTPLKRTDATTAFATLATLTTKPKVTTRRSVSVVIPRRTSYNPTPSEVKPEVVVQDPTPSKESSIKFEPSEELVVPIKVVAVKQKAVKQKKQVSESSESDFAIEMDSQFKQRSDTRLSLKPSTATASIKSVASKAVTDKENINASSTDSDSYTITQPQKTPKKKQTKTAKAAKPTPVPISSALKAPVFNSTQSTLRRIINKRKAVSEDVMEEQMQEVSGSGYSPVANKLAKKRIGV